MAYLKLWVDPNIVSESQIQLPDKVVVGKNEDGSDKYNLVTNKNNVIYDTAEDAGVFLLDPDPKYLQMPVWYAETKDNLSKSYLYVSTRHMGYANYWTFYIASKLRIGIDTDDYGTYLRLGCKGNIKAEDEITKIHTTYRTLVDGTKDYYLLPACAEGNHKKGGYYGTPPGSYIVSTYTKDNSKNIGKTDAMVEIDTGTYTSKHVATNYNLGIGCAVLLIDRITFAEGVTEVLLPIGNDPNDAPYTFILCKADGYYYYLKVWIRSSGYFKSEPLQDFDITIPHTYIFISSSYPNSTVEVWVDGKQYKKEDGTDFDNSPTKYNKFSLSVSWDDFNTHNIYEFRLIQGEEPGDLEYPLKAYITASRNPVIFNKPSLSTSKLTCHVEGALNHKVNLSKYFVKGKLCLLWDPENKEFIHNSYDASGNLDNDNSGVTSVVGSELDVVDGAIVRSNKGDPSNTYGFGSNMSWGVPNLTPCLKILNIDCKIIYSPEEDNVLFYDDVDRSSAIEISVQLIRGTRYLIKLSDNEKGLSYFDEYSYDPCEWHTYTICASYNYGYLYLFIDGNLALYCSKVGGKSGYFKINFGNALTDLSPQGSPVYKNTVYYKNIVEHDFYIKDVIMGGILKEYYKHDKYIKALTCFIDCTGDYVKYIDSDGGKEVSNVPVINNSYFNLYTTVSETIGKRVYYVNTGEYYMWEETSQIVSIGNDYVTLMYMGSSLNYDNVLHIVPTVNDEYIIKTPNYTSEELDGLYEKHTYRTYLKHSLTDGNYYFTHYRDGKKIQFYKDGEPVDDIIIYGDAFSISGARINRIWIGLFYAYDKYTDKKSSINFYSRKVYKLTENPDYEEIEENPELTYLWNTGETTEQITVQPTEPTVYTCTVTQGSRTASASILIDAIAKYSKPVAVISPQSKPYVEHMLGKFYGTNSYDTNDIPGEIIKYIWNGVETASPVLTTRVTKTDIITLQVVNIYGEISDEVQVDLSQGGFDQWGYSYKFLDFPVFLVCSKGASLYDTLMSRFPIPTSTKDLYTTRYDTEYPQYTRIGFATDISNDTITYIGCFPHYGVAEYIAPRDELDIYPLGVSWLEKRKILKYFDKVKGSKGSLLTCIGHPEMKEEGYGNLEFVLNALGIITPKDRYTIPRLLDLLELFLIDYENGGLIEL